jgi:16S rRNA (adenine1518-N6/adenine1519-N6)-dimethyltransferase
MCDAGRVAPGDIVFEIGPGSGVLTKEILARGAKGIALEADQRAVEILEEQYKDEIASGDFILHHGDARQLNLSELGLKNGQYKAVSNIPYYLSGHLFRNLLESDCQPSDLVFLVQKEVAERIARDPKESLLSLSVKVFGEPQYIKTVGKGHFTPPPAIDSAIILISNISKQNFKDLDSQLFFDLIHLGFGARRKQLLGNLSKHYDRVTLTNIFSTLELPLDIRAEDLSLEKWLTLAKAIAIHMKSTATQ